MQETSQPVLSDAAVLALKNTRELASTRLAKLRKFAQEIRSGGEVDLHIFEFSKPSDGLFFAGRTTPGIKLWDDLEVASKQTGNLMLIEKIIGLMITESLSQIEKATELLNGQRPNDRAGIPADDPEQSQE